MTYLMIIGATIPNIIPTYICPELLWLKPPRITIAPSIIQSQNPTLIMAFNPFPIFILIFSYIKYTHLSHLGEENHL